VSASKKTLGPVTADDPEFIMIPEMARTGWSDETLYRRARLGDLPGAVKMGGRSYRVNWTYWLSTTGWKTPARTV
jgi:predicted DNA-binding transcriptional regulator AlpA